jgi:ferrous iron transport protein A
MNLQGSATYLLMTQLDVGQRARVLGFQSESEYNTQLQRLGVIAGTEFEVIRKAPLGDPIEIRLRGYSLALRPREATAVLIQVIS